MSLNSRLESNKEEGESEGDGRHGRAAPEQQPHLHGEREFFIDNLLVRIYFIIEMILVGRPTTPDSGPLRAVHFSRHKWRGGLDLLSTHHLHGNVHTAISHTCPHTFLVNPAVSYRYRELCE